MNARLAIPFLSLSHFLRNQPAVEHTLIFQVVIVRLDTSRHDRRGETVCPAMV